LFTRGVFAAQLSNFGNPASRATAGERSPSNDFNRCGGTLVHSTILAHQIVRRVDQREMREGLREISQLSPGGWVVLRRSWSVEDGQ
jgi:hypothetical protein